MRKLACKDIEELNGLSRHTMMEALGIRFTRMGEDFIEAEMPVDHRTHQVHGLLHGGASAVLAETLGSVGAMLTLDSGSRCVGIEINANHLRSVTSGKVVGVARPLHTGRTTQVWEIRVATPDGKPVCVSRLTLAVVPSPSTAV
jgi:1,4-dihydroxy-2-naphthoyl-CoA hydrolase